MQVSTNALLRFTTVFTLYLTCLRGDQLVTASEVSARNDYE